MSNSLFRRKSISNILNEGADDVHGSGGLKRVLTVKDLTFFGIAAILGAGSFSSLGAAVFNGGPGVVILFIITGIACAFTAFCYSDCLHLRLCEFRRTVRLDYRMGFDHGIFYRQYLCGL